MSTTEHPQPAPTPFPWPFLFRYVYAAKFLCGELKPGSVEAPVEPGSYSTAINVHNPHGQPIAIRKKAILLYNAEHPEDAVERPTPPVHGECMMIKELGPDWGLEIDCRDIREVLLKDASGKAGPPAPVFIKGWVVIETLSDRPVDVVAFYTAGPLEAAGAARSSPSIETERVPGTRTFLPGF